MNYSIIGLHVGCGGLVIESTGQSGTVNRVCALCRGDSVAREPIEVVPGSPTTNGSIERCEACNMAVPSAGLALHEGNAVCVVHQNRARVAREQLVLAHPADKRIPDALCVRMPAYYHQKPGGPTLGSPATFAVENVVKAALETMTAKFKPALARELFSRLCPDPVAVQLVKNMSLEALRRALGQSFPVIARETNQ